MEGLTTSGCTVLTAGKEVQRNLRFWPLQAG